MPNERRPNTYSRKFNSSAEPRRAVGKYYDESDCKVKPCRFNVGSGEDAEKRLTSEQTIHRSDREWSDPWSNEVSMAMADSVLITPDTPLSQMPFADNLTCEPLI